MSFYPIEVSLVTDGGDDVDLGIDSGAEIGMDTDTEINASSDKHYVHTQMVASASWTIEHNLNKFPSVSIVDSGGSVVVGEIQYINKDILIVSFAGAFSGVAYLN